MCTKKTERSKEKKKKKKKRERERERGLVQGRRKEKKEIVWEMKRELKVRVFQILLFI